MFVAAFFSMPSKCATSSAACGKPVFCGLSCVASLKLLSASNVPAESRNANHGMPLVGGETAEMPDVYREGEYDLAGTILGVVSEQAAIHGDKVKPGDVLLQIDGRPVVDPQSVLNVVTVIAPGSAAKVKLKRKGQDLELPVTIGRRPRQQAQPE